jgi:sortase (surface protein transpeptidase)
MLPTTGPTITLISCYPYLIDTHRIVLFGELIERTENGELIK